MTIDKFLNGKRIMSFVARQVYVLCKPPMQAREVGDLGKNKPTLFANLAMRDIASTVSLKCSTKPKEMTIPRYPSGTSILFQTSLE
jgi:hypothetical protein